MKVTLSATISGKKTNRIRAKHPKATSAGKALRRYRQDPAVRGLDTVIICVSMPVEALARIDQNAERAQMCRSAWLRRASEHFEVKVFGPGKAGR